MSAKKTEGLTSLDVPKSPSARRNRASTMLGEAKSKPAHGDRRPFDHFVVIGCDPTGTEKTGECLDSPGVSLRHHKRPSTTDFVYSVNNASSQLPKVSRTLVEAESDQSGDIGEEHSSDSAVEHPEAAQYTAPRILYHYPPSTALKHEAELKLFCMPFQHSPRPIKRSKGLTELNDLIYGASVELEKSSNSFVIVLTVGSHLLYGVCVISQELCSVLPSFIDHEVMPLHKERFLAVNRCYCFLTDAPLFDTHFSVLYSILAIERMQLLRRIPVLLDSNLLREEPDAGRGNQEQALRILERYYSQRIPMPGTGVKRSVLLKEPIRAECLLTGGNAMEMISEWTVPTLFQCLSVEQLLSFYVAILLESPIVIVSKNLRWLSAFTLAVVPLLSPLVWQGPLITVLPEALFEYLDSPVPLIAGVTSSSAFGREDMLVVDLDQRLVTTPKAFHRLPGHRKLLQELEKVEAVFSNTSSAPTQASKAVRRAVSAFQEHTAWLIEDLLGDVNSNDVTAPGGLLDPPVTFTNVTADGAAQGRKLGTAPKATQEFVKQLMATQQFSVYMGRVRKELHSNKYRLSMLNGHVQSARDSAALTRENLKQQIELMERQLVEVKEYEQTLERTQTDIEEVLGSVSCNLNSAISVEEHANSILEAIAASGTVPMEEPEDTYFREGPKLSKDDIHQLLACATKMRYKPARDVTLEQELIYFVASGKIIANMRGALLHPIGQGTFLSHFVAAEESIVLETEEETLLYRIWPADVVAHLRPEAAMMVAWSRARTLAHMLLLMNTACTAVNRSIAIKRPLTALQVGKKINVIVRATLEATQITAAMSFRPKSSVGDLYKRCTVEFGDSFTSDDGSIALEYIPLGETKGRMLSDYDQCLAEFTGNEEESSGAELSFVLRFVDPSHLVQEFRCKWERSGRLYLMSKEAVHFSRLFGMESRRSFLYSDIMLLPQEEDTLLVSIRNERPVKLTFQSKTHAEQAMQLVSILKSQSHESDSRIKGRATVVKAFQARKVGQVSLERGQEVLLLAEPAAHGWHMGVVQGQTGAFPAKCVLVQNSHGRTSSNNLAKSASDTTDQPSREDWKRILSAGMISRFEAGESLIREGVPSHCIFQVIEGSCSVKRDVQPDRGLPSCSQRRFASSPSLSMSIGGETDDDSLDDGDDSVLGNDSRIGQVELGTLGVDQVAGEVALLMGTLPTASVVATSSTEVYMISGFFLRYLFTSDPLLGWRFFNYLAATLDERIMQHCLTPLRRNSAPRLLTSSSP